MNLEEMKKYIEEATGVPADKLLTGDTPEENMAKAKAILAYVKYTGGTGATQKKTTREQFAEFAGNMFERMDRSQEVFADQLRKGLKQ